MTEIPAEISIVILSFLESPNLLCRYATVSKAWHSLVEDFELWKDLFIRNYGLPNSLKSKNTNKQPSLIDWKFLFKNAYTLNQNWLEGSYHVNYVEAHLDSVYCLQFDQSKIVTGSRDHTIKFWDTHTIQPLKTFQGHTASVLCLQYNEFYIVSGSSDTSIIVWDIHTGEILKTLLGHRAPVLDVRLSGDEIFSCSKDFSIKKWDLKTGLVVRSYDGHLAAVNAISVDRNFLASASGNLMNKYLKPR